MDLTKMTFVMACKSHFGYKSGQTLQQFAAELKDLTSQDKLELTTMFQTIGIDATKQGVGA